MGVKLSGVVVTSVVWMNRHLQPIELFVVTVGLEELDCVEWPGVVFQWGIGCQSLYPVYGALFTVRCVECRILVC